MHDKWQPLGTNRTIHLIDLDPGDYTLHVKASNNDGVWTNPDRILYISIHPAWWNTWIFRGFSIVFLVSFVLITHRIRVNNLVFRQKELAIEVKKRTSELSEKNSELKFRHKEIIELNKEIQAQVEELISQNEEIMAQRDKIEEQKSELETVHTTLQKTNKTLEKKVEERTSKLTKTIKELDRFVYSASHDLAAPLKSILGLVHIANIDNKNKRIEEYLTFIEKSIFKLEKVIKNLVSYSRNSRLEISRKNIDLLKLVEESCNELKYLPKYESIKISMIIPSELTISSDRERLKVILNNLIGNAIKYVDPDKKNAFIKIIGYVKSSKLFLTVEDNGIGISDVYKTKIFDMFYRATEMSDGSGLGLYIVKETVEKLGGEVTLDSTEKVGSKFHVVLPLPSNGTNS